MGLAGEGTSAFKKIAISRPPLGSGTRSGLGLIDSHVKMPNFRASKNTLKAWYYFFLLILPIVSSSVHTLRERSIFLPQPFSCL